MTLDEYVIDSHRKGWKNFDDWAHFQRQFIYLVDGNEYDVDHILCNEQWDEGMERLYHTVGIYDIPHNSSGHSHMLQNEHETCADLNPAIRRAIESYYAMDYCLFEYDQIPNSGNGQCIGATTTKEEFQEKFRACRKKMSEMNEKHDYGS